MKLTRIVRSAARRMAPPALYRRLKLQVSRLADATPQSLSFSPRPSFQAALADAGSGYNDSSLAGPFTDQIRLDELRDFDAPVLAAIALATLSKGPEINVLDFGGGAGRMKAMADSYFGVRARMKWLVVETAEQVDANKSTDPETIRFSTEIEPIAYDLSLFSGSLQYLSDWEKPLKNASKSDLIMICRTPLADEEQPFVQSVFRNGRTYKFAARVIARDEIVALLSSTHTLLASWDLESHLIEMGVHKSPSMLWQKKV